MKQEIEKAKLEELRKQIDPEKANFEEVRNNITEYGIRIVMDEEKIIKEDKYDLDKIYQAIDEIAEFAKMVSINDTPSALGCFVFTNLEEQEWFMNNVKEWTWYDDEGVFDIIKFIEEDNKNGS